MATHQASALQSHWEDQAYAEPLLCAEMDVTVPQLNRCICGRMSSCAVQPECLLPFLRVKKMSWPCRESYLL